MYDFSRKLIVKTIYYLHFILPHHYFLIHKCFFIISFFFFFLLNLRTNRCFARRVISILEWQLFLDLL